MEIGQALHRLGVRTAIIGRGRALKYLHDPEVRLAAADIFAEKLCFAPDAKTTKTKLINERLQVDFTDYSGKRLSESFEYALAAAGRIPNLEKLSLENSDLELDENGIPAYDPATMQCGDSNVFIAGDATGKRPFLHEAIHEGRIAARNAVRYPTVEREARHTPLSIVFTSPQAGYAGKRYDELDLDNAAVAKLSFKEQARSRIIGKGRGLMHIYADKSNGRIIGTEMIGPAAEHLVHLLAWAIEKQFTVDDLRNLPFYHPVIEEGIFYSLEELQ
jgi:dihydrolipoamide dehydrogenase